MPQLLRWSARALNAAVHRHRRGSLSSTHYVRPCERKQCELAGAVSPALSAAPGRHRFLPWHRTLARLAQRRHFRTSLGLPQTPARRAIAVTPADCAPPPQRRWHRAHKPRMTANRGPLLRTPPDGEQARRTHWRDAPWPRRPQPGQRWRYAPRPLRPPHSWPLRQTPADRGRGQRMPADWQPSPTSPAGFGRAPRIPDPSPSRGNRDPWSLPLGPSSCIIAARRIAKSDVPPNLRST